MKPATIISPSKLEEQLSTRNSISPSKLEGDGGSVTDKNADYHTPQSLRDSSSKLEGAGGSVTASQLRVVIVGSGNVATCFALALKDKCTIVQVYSRNPAHAQALAERVGCPWTSSTDQLAPDGEVYIVAVNDDAIAALGQAVLDNGAVWVHTSGSTSIDALSATRCRCGVMWPMQSLSKSHAAALGQVHLFIEGSDSEVLMQLRELALLITPNVHEVSGADRLKLHVASVFASNFSNHMYSLAAEVLAEAGIPFEALLPLIKSTVDKLDAMPPAQSQTGPAARGDEGVMAKHLAMLTGDKQEIYRMLSRSIAKRRSE